MTREIAQALCVDYETAGLVGTRKMGCVNHVPTGYEFLLMPGGSFAMGITEAEEDRILAPLRPRSGAPR